MSLDWNWVCVCVWALTSLIVSIDSQVEHLSLNVYFSVFVCLFGDDDDVDEQNKSYLCQLSLLSFEQCTAKCVSNTNEIIERTLVQSASRRMSVSIKIKLIMAGTFEFEATIILNLFRSKGEKGGERYAANEWIRESIALCVRCGSAFMFSYFMR